ncbi:MAG: hypothetical protein JRI23_32575 [Deltaproteobacteria bacterium]|jgi:hypothetical protein|nr:hypothetical protein [Deltaproteobacteria bacterium]MBW2536981.1 hypothetical protein [Deltaproteobacteria bacterium]
MRGLVALAPWLLAPLLGCSATVADDDDDGAEPAPASTQASVTVERSVTLPTGDDAMRLSTRVMARFIQVSGGIDHEFADRVVGSRRELPAPGSCEWRSSTGLEPLPTVATSGAIDLLDVGDVILHAGGSSLPLAPRAFPDVGDLVSGVIYSSRDDSTALPAGESYEIETTGSELADGFRLSIDAPGAPDQVRIGDEPLDSEELVIPVGEALGVQWLAGRDGRDQIVVDLAPWGSDGRQLNAARCSFEDSGSAIVPEAFVTWSDEVGGLDLSVHRVRRAELKAPELDEAVVEFDFAVAARLSVTYEP